MTTAAGVAAALRAEARTTNQRRLLVLAGSADTTREAAVAALDATDLDDGSVTYLGTGAGLPWESLEPKRAGDLLGTTRGAVVLDCHDECRPNAVGRAVGAVDGGGLLLVLAPPLDEWPARRDGFDETLAVPPFDVEDVNGNFRRRLVDLLRAHPGIAIVDADDDEVRRDGLTDPAPRLSESAVAGPTPPDSATFPAHVYEGCLTGDQVEAVAALEALGEPEQAVVVEADRGRGKSSAAGLAAAALALEGADVLVTAGQYRNAAAVFDRAAERLAAVGALAETDHPENRHRIETEAGRIRFERPTAAADVVDGTDESADRPDAVVVDEAAALPVALLERFLAPDCATAFVTTVHGYEGAGRGFSVRFRDRLDDAPHAVTEVRMDDPIRYAAGDPVEVWAFRALMLDAGPPADQLVADATPENATYRRLDAADLLADEHLLREAFGLLVYAHYRTEPDDLARLLDAPNVAVRALTDEGRVVSVALLAREGALPADLRARMYEGERVRGNMIPDVLTSQLRDEDAGVPKGLRVLRIATHHTVRSRGLGSALLDAVHEEFADTVDWFGTGYGATPGLLRFWRANGYGTVHLSTTRNDASGEYSAVMLRPANEAGRGLHCRHSEWFADRVTGMLTDPLDDADPDVIRETLRSVEAVPDPELSPWEWRLLAGMASGAGIFDTAPRPLRLLAVRWLIDAGGTVDRVDGSAEGTTFDDREERLLVRKALQCHDWEQVAADLGYPSQAECMRAVGRIAGSLVSRYGPPYARDELERYE